MTRMAVTHGWNLNQKKHHSQKVSRLVPIGSMYGIFTYIWLIFMVNHGKYTIHGSYGVWLGVYPRLTMPTLIRNSVQFFWVPFETLLFTSVFLYIFVAVSSCRPKQSTSIWKQATNGSPDCPAVIYQAKSLSPNLCGQGPSGRWADAEGVLMASIGV